MSRRQLHLLLAGGLLAAIPSGLLAQQSQQPPAARPAEPTLRAMPAPPPAYEAVPPPAALPPGVVHAGPPGALITLDQASDLAMQFNPRLAQARAQIDSKQGLAIQAGMMPNPRWDTNNPQVFAGNQSQYNAGFAQEVPVKGKLRLSRAAATQDVGQARYAYIRQRFDLLTAVRQQFYRVLAQERRVEVLAQLVQIATKSHAAAQQRERAAVVAETDVLLLLVELQQAQIALQNARTQLAGAQRALAATIGVPDLLIQDALGDLPAHLPDFDEEMVRRFVATQNASVLSAQLQITQNRFLLQRARVEPYPNPYVGPAVAWGPSSSSSSNYGSQFWFNVQFNIPAWNLNQGNIRAANADVRESIAAVGVLQNDLLRQTSEALAAYRAARDRAHRIYDSGLPDEILPTAQRTQRLVQNAYDVGERDVAPVLQAQRALTQVNLDYIDALESAWMSAAELAGLLQVERFP